MDTSKKIRVRVAPSPTGFFHIGNFRTGLYNYLFAKKYGGTFLLRVEDTDQARLVPGSLENIVQTLSDFGISPTEGVIWKDGKVAEKGDAGPYVQSKRLGLYRKYAEELVAKKAAYHCFCTPQRLDELRKTQEAGKLPPKYDKHCLNLSEQEIQGKLAAGEKHVIRLNVPAAQVIKFKDLVHGEISISTNDVDDQVLMKSDGFPTYHLAVVVDDNLMGITHVLRGEEWIPSTPKHVLLYRAFGWEAPGYVHLPLLLSKTKKKLSKREGDVSVKDFLAKGYLPEALINFVALLGWNPKTEQEVFSLEELANEFKVENINKSGAVFDLEKLDWINGLYIRQLPLGDLHDRIKPYLAEAGLPCRDYPDEFIQAILKLERDRLKKLSEIGERVRYFFEEPQYDAELLVWKKSSREDAKKNLEILRDYVKDIPGDKFQKDFLESEIKKFLADQNIQTGDALWPLRAALSGLAASPSPFEIMEAFGTLPNGKDMILSRIDSALKKLS
jgi:nondiscriminating glutamyl-tRNA synthetase